MNCLLCWQLMWQIYMHLSIMQWLKGTGEKQQLSLYLRAACRTSPASPLAVWGTQTTMCRIPSIIRFDKTFPSVFLSNRHQRPETLLNICHALLNTAFVLKSKDKHLIVRNKKVQSCKVNTTLLTYTSLVM